MVCLRAHRLFADAYVDTPDEDFESDGAETDLTEQVTTYFAADIPVHVHAIGGAAVRMTLDAIADARRITSNETVRATIAHMDFVSEEDVPRFASAQCHRPNLHPMGSARSLLFQHWQFCWYEQGRAGLPIRSLMDAARIKALARIGRRPLIDL